MVFTEKRSNVLHGILLIALFSLSAFYIAGFEFVERLSFSPLIVGILLGMLYANSLRNHLPETWVPGIKFCSKQGQIDMNTSRWRSVSRIAPASA